MGQDLLLALQWWLILLAVTWAAFPISRIIFSNWNDRGYLLAKPLGMLLVTYVVYLGATLRLMPFTSVGVWMVAGGLFAVGWWFVKNKGGEKINFKLIAAEEIVFLVGLLFWAWIKAHEPSIHGLEKFMDFGFMKSILNSSFFPAKDMWLAGNFPINYYYFGHTTVAVLVKMSGVGLNYAFNLMLASLFSLTLVLSFSIAYQLAGKKWAAVLGALIITIGGNLQTIYAFTKGYSGDDTPPPFWEIFTGKLNSNYWYPNATRFIPYTIHEFPSYSFVVSDLHGHVLAIPFALLAIALLMMLFQQERLRLWTWGLFGLVGAVLFSTNALDSPIYLGLGLLILATKYKISRVMVGPALAMVAAAGIFSLPFLWHFKSFVNGLAINCPPGFLADSKIGPFIFESVDKCQKSPTWMLSVLWGFFWYCAAWVGFKYKRQVNMFVGALIIYSLGLIIFPEFFYFKDIYPLHFRSNTMFKLGYQAFIMLGFVSSFAIAKIKSRWFHVGLVLPLFLVLIYPFFSVNSYFGGLNNYQGLDGMEWLYKSYPNDALAINWIDKNTPKESVVVEAVGESYTDYGRVSAFTGRQTIIGWPVHEWLWRGSYDVAAPRIEEVKNIYTSGDAKLNSQILIRYNASYVMVGDLEREKYPDLDEKTIASLGREVFRAGQTAVYAIDLKRSLK